jgi:molybdopterin converting factor small subunit
MKVRVLLFGPEAAATGRGSVELDLPEPATCAALQERLSALPSLAASLPSARLAVNHEFADPDQILGPHDEIALIGLVSGG